MTKLQAFLDKALSEKSKRDSAHLGNRATYVGASDVCGCPRKAVLAKQCPIDHDSATLLKFARGHAAEDLIDDIFRSGGLTPEREVEVRHPDHPALLCHIDFLFTAQNGRRHVVELKTTDGLPDFPYGSWINQLHFQMGLLAMKTPDAEIGGSILAVDLNQGVYREFNGYRPDALTFNLLVDKGQRIKACIDGGETPDVEPGLLCGFCPYRRDCPAFQDGAVSIPDAVSQLARIYLDATEMKKEIEQRIDRVKGDILAFTGSSFKGAADDVFINAFAVAPGESVDTKTLKTRFPDVYAQVKKDRAGYTRLEIKAL